MVAVFDLDDTLYNEVEFVKSGFFAVACNVDPTRSHEIYAAMCKDFDQHGSGKIFDNILKTYPQVNLSVSELVALYKEHEPCISLPVESKVVLEYAQKYHTAMITDGEAQMQKNKFYALGLEKYIAYPVFTGEHDTKKPELKAFQMVMKHYSDADSFVYISDNPKKDFSAPQELGWRTIRYKNPDGIYKEIKNSAQVEIERLYEVIALL